MKKNSKKENIISIIIIVAVIVLLYYLKLSYTGETYGPFEGFMAFVGQ